LKFSLLILISISLTISSCIPEPEIQGNVLKNHNSIPFNVTDHNGQKINSLNMNHDFFLMTFVFTECTDVCPIVVSQIKQALVLNSSETTTPVILISVDPQNDNNESVNEFITKWELSSNWSYIYGSHNSLETIWENYFINPISLSTIEDLSNKLASKNKIIHTSPVYIFNKNGKAQVVHNSPIIPKKLLNDIKAVSRQ